MLHFSKVLCFFLLCCSVFSCARREQAFYQRSPREQFSQPTVQPSLKSAPLVLDADPTAISPHAEAIEASVHTTPVLEASSPEWNRTPKVSPLPEKATTYQPVARQQKVRLYKSILRKNLLDAPVQTSGLAVASLVCGILGLFIFSVILGPLAIIFGGVALSKIRRNPEIRGRGLAIAGLVMGIVATVIILIVLAAR